MSVLSDQVGEDGTIRDGQVAVVTLRGSDAAYLVPANAYWRARVENGEER